MPARKRFFFNWCLPLLIAPFSYISSRYWSHTGCNWDLHDKAAEIRIVIYMMKQLSSQSSSFSSSELLLSLLSLQRGKFFAFASSSHSAANLLYLMWVPWWHFDHDDMDGDYVVMIIAVSGLTEHCYIFHFPPACVRASVCHGRDISTFLDNLMV